MSRPVKSNMFGSPRSEVGSKADFGSRPCHSPSTRRWTSVGPIRMYAAQARTFLMLGRWRLQAGRLTVVSVMPCHIVQVGIGCRGPRAITEDVVRLVCSKGPRRGSVGGPSRGEQHRLNCCGLESQQAKEDGLQVTSPAPRAEIRIGLEHRQLGRTTLNQTQKL